MKSVTHLSQKDIILNVKKINEVVNTLVNEGDSRYLDSPGYDLEGIVGNIANRIASRFPEGEEAPVGIITDVVNDELVSVLDALQALVLFITSGSSDRYRSRNPYGIPEVKNALRFVKGTGS